MGLFSRKISLPLCVRVCVFVCVCVVSMGDNALVQRIQFFDYTIWTTHQGTESKITSFRSETCLIGLCVFVYLYVCVYLCVCEFIRASV